MPGLHKTLAPSAAHRWMRCPGSIRAESGHEDTDSPHAAYGTAAHVVASRALEYEKDADFYLGEMISVSADGRRLVECDQEMVDGVQVYLDYVRRLRGDFTLIEQWADLTHVLPEEGAGGTADYIAVAFGDSGAATVDTVDLKFGVGVQVFAEENEQLMLYALGALREVELMADSIDAVRLHIVQPRLDHIDVWETTADHLRQFAKRAEEAGRLALSKDAPRVPGGKQCRFCADRTECRARAEYLMQSIADQFEDCTSPVALKDSERLNNAELAHLFNLSGQIANWLTDLKALAMARRMDGQELPGLKLVRGRGSRDWADPDRAEAFVKRLVGAKDAYTKKLVSPAQLEKKVGKDTYGKRVAKYVTKNPGAPTLVHESDKRPAISPSDLLGFDDVSKEEDNDQ